MTASSPGHGPAGPGDAAGPPGAHRSGESVVRSYLAAINAHDLDAVVAHVTVDFDNEHTSVRGDSLRGRAAYRERLDGFLASMPGLRYDIERLATDGSSVVVAYAMSASYLVGGAERPFGLRGVFWFEVLDGLIAHRIDYRDSAELESQVGLR